jgi:hypothetical protein
MKRKGGSEAPRGPSSTGPSSAVHPRDLLLAVSVVRPTPRPRRTGSWCLDVTLAEGDSEAWVYRRDPRIRVPWPQAVLSTADGVPYLAPELQLLFKSKDAQQPAGPSRSSRPERDYAL